MSKNSNMQRLAVLKVWIDDVKKNSRYRKEQKKQPKWLIEALKDLDYED